MGHLSRTRGKLHLPCAERIYMYYKASTVCVKYGKISIQVAKKYYCIFTLKHTHAPLKEYTPWG